MHEVPRLTDADFDALFLVGDVFAEFAHHDGVLTVSQLAREVRNGTFPGGAGEVRVTLGQGVSAFDVQYVRDTLDRRGLADRVVIDDRALHARAGREIAHKHRAENVLISRPRPTGPGRFESDLLVDAGNEVMSDHLTGQHMQGMLAMEAGRQMFIAVAEQHYLPREAIGSSYFVIDTFATRYRNFLFPLPATVRCHVVSHRSPHRTRMAFHCELAVLQGGSQTAEMEVRFTAFDTQVSHAKETRAARRSLQDTAAAMAAAQEEQQPTPAAVRTA
ncbi:AfsA-related hotdog domain-containing protein [Streptomyces sp. HNM0663]|uniref:AfsA-related hotdog domain-containing protein n=1 Tax=Streptomyces chengmaiensis TaxID=3040919 RepID=A0ABT6HR42_9ACTN|nr:AfsA-related hotdog domain-containing protein [Streptomyces chengmaiensis]MDH2391184.1 AfsA-related hotdog domain-containing protein [Streptomyces chengmaiensis]